MKTIALILTAVLKLTLPLSAADKPNIVVILSDDQGWMDYGFMGHEDIETPHLDKLAASSVLFERGYVASPLCRPSLASILTGRMPSEHGITGNDVDAYHNREALDKPLRSAFHKFPTFVKLLAANGYLAHQSGKWWEGSFQDGGFTDGMTQGGRHGDKGLAIGRGGIKPITDFLDHATKENKPFLVWYAPFLPHTPHDPPPRLLEKYTRQGRAADVAKYYAMCEWFDETCGGLLDDLERRGLRENTLVIYLCDNGWAAASQNEDDPNQKLWKDYALRSKSSPFEMGIRTPVMLSWPDRFKALRTSDLAHAIDIFPTIAAAAGIETPKGLSGINLLDETARKNRDTVFGVAHSVHNMTPGNPDGTLQYRWAFPATGNS
jgi:arylsulfatase A-like enzyme